jgi:hypothetical protein
MKDITADVIAATTARIASGTEFIWDEVRSKVILFRNSEPRSFITLDDHDNRQEAATRESLSLLAGHGLKL